MSIGSTCQTVLQRLPADAPMVSSESDHLQTRIARPHVMCFLQHRCVCHPHRNATQITAQSNIGFTSDGFSRYPPEFASVPHTSEGRARATPNTIRTNFAVLHDTHINPLSDPILNTFCRIARAQPSVCPVPHPHTPLVAAPDEKSGTTRPEVLTDRFDWGRLRDASETQESI